MHTNIGVALKPTFMYPLLSCRVLYKFEYVFSSITLRILNLHNKSPDMTDRRFNEFRIPTNFQTFHDINDKSIHIEP